MQTISRRLRENKFYACVARAKEFSSPGHCSYRLQFAEQHINFNQWDRTLFVDESAFQTESAIRTLVRRPPRSPFDECYLKTVANSGRQPVSVFGIIIVQGSYPLVRIDGCFDSERNFEILDNTGLKMSSKTEIFFTIRTIHQFIDHEWLEIDLIVALLQNNLLLLLRNHPILNLMKVRGGEKKLVSETGIYADEEDLWLAIGDAWLDMQDNYDCQNLINSIPNRLQNIIVTIIAIILCHIVFSSKSIESNIKAFSTLIMNFGME